MGRSRQTKQKGTKGANEQFQAIVNKTQQGTKKELPLNMCLWSSSLIWGLLGNEYLQTRFKLLPRLAVTGPWKSDLSRPVLFEG